jgi:hypothetical protein
VRFAITREVLKRMECTFWCYMHICSIRFGCVPMPRTRSTHLIRMMCIRFNRLSPLITFYAMQLHYYYTYPVCIIMIELSFPRVVTLYVLNVARLTIHSPKSKQRCKIPNKNAVFRFQIFLL